MSEEAFEKEKHRLELILNQYKTIIDDTEINVKKVIDLCKEKPEVYVKILQQIENRLINLIKSKDKPYFARIDFVYDESGQKEVYYIGKIGVADVDNNIVTVDWRAPISAIYYDSNIGKTSYVAPGGMMTGLLDLKRQFEIESGKLIGFNDVDTVSSDDLLKPYLGVNADSRLKNIVASIQGEQNKIIRENINKNIIVQGVAGSGKTTVALHRIAYLVYNNMENIKPEQYMVIGPNKFFIKYISSVLPELDVAGVPQLTYEELAKEYVGEEFNIINSSGKGLDYNNVGNTDIDKYKTSLQYKKLIDNFVAFFEKTVVPKEDFKIKGFPVIKRELVEKKYFECDAIYESVQARVDKTILLLSKHVRDNFDAISSNLTKYVLEELQKAKGNDATLKKIQNNREFIKRELERECSQSLKRHFSKVDTKILTLYNAFLSNVESFKSNDLVDYKKLKEETLLKLKKRNVEFEDLAALMYLKERVKGAGIYKKYKHIVIDEAQDYGEFNFYVLNKMMTEGSFTIFGDLAQSIYSYRSIDSWNEVIENVFENKCTVQPLLKSYRTTVEIMNIANNLTDFIGLDSAQPVIRHGNKVDFIDADEKERLKHICKKVDEYKEKGYQSIAVISKTTESTEKINNALKQEGMVIDHILKADDEYSGGICTITSHLSKGLEFDAVIIDDASETNYHSSRKTDMQLLYVAMTRPLHELTILYNKTITLPLEAVISIEKEIIDDKGFSVKR